MLKRLFIILISLINSVAIYAQQYTPKDLLGRWESTRNKTANVVFLTDSTGAWLASDGFLYNKMNYSAKVNKDIIELKYTIDIARKHPQYSRPYIKFLNDSIFLMRYGWAIPKNADTSNKKVYVYKKIKKELPETAIHLPDYKDLIGVWESKLKDSTKFQKFTFVDASTLYIQTSAQGLNKMKYVVDFTRQPITMDVYFENRLIKQCFIGFYGKDTIDMQYFDANKRGDHFTVFGKGALLHRNKNVDASLYHK